MAVNSSSLILHDVHFRAELGNQITSLYVGVKLCFSRVVIHILQGSFYISDNIYTDSRILGAYIIRDLFVVVLTDRETSVSPSD